MSIVNIRAKRALPHNPFTSIAVSLSNFGTIRSIDTQVGLYRSFSWAATTLHYATTLFSVLFVASE